ncbi:MAG: glycosyltransferase [Pricia sp.]
MISVPVVSVSIITYNHEKFIAKAIESVLNQKTDFDYEIIIGDDCSTDGTRKIIEEYRRRHPDKIQLILHPRRYKGIPGRLNNITNIYACRGKYTAMLDGDDYWVNDNKLQIQVDFLERNNEYVAIANDALKVNIKNEFIGKYYSGKHAILKEDNSFTQEDVLKAGWCLTQTSSLLFRNKMFKEFPGWFWNIISADYVLLLLLSKYGNIKYLREPYTAYRIHDGSFTAMHYLSRKILGLKIKELQLVRKLFLPYRPNVLLFRNIRASATLNKRIATFKYGYASCIRREENFWSAIVYLVKESFSNFSFVYFFEKAVQNLKTD